ncbi:hypothetical protein OG21DRAFT_1511663 [Imleria badia]|nr:hypothetical protein OG21DRAFT_1511663 [Imleria badia]
MHIIPLILIILILVFILCIRPLLVSSLRRGHARWVTSSTRGSEHGILEEEERLMFHDEEHDTSPRQDSDQPLRSSGDRTFARGHFTAEIDRWKHADARTAEEIEIARDNIAKLQQELSTSVSQGVELQRRYETLSRELESARLFLNTADTFADSEVIQMLTKLNAELQHTSTLVADRVVSVFKLDAISSEPEQQIVVNRTSGSIGSTLVQFLRSGERADFEVPMYLQIAFQAYLTHQLCWIVSSWTLDSGCNAFINEIYQRLRETEKQGISGRWRSLTRVYALPTCVNEPNSLVTPIITGLSDILLAAGCVAPKSDIMSELSSMFENKILTAVSLAGRLNQMIGGVVSGDFEVFVVRPGETFQGGYMEEDTDGSGNGLQGTPTAKTVLCTSELGLTKRVQLGTGEKETKMVIKAKVILESFLDNEN